MDKREVARRQLGVALDLFLRKSDPVCIHTLAMAGGEIAEWLAEQSRAEPFRDHALATFPDLSLKELRSIQRKYVNAFKHATGFNRSDRDDDQILQSFTSDANEDVLFIGWYDLAQSGSPRPIEAHAFEAWYLAKYPEKLNPDEAHRPAKLFPPNFASLSSQRQHHLLVEKIIKAKKDSSVMGQAIVDRRPLVLPWPQGLARRSQLNWNR